MCKRDVNLTVSALQKDVNFIVLHGVTALAEYDWHVVDTRAFVYGPIFFHVGILWKVAGYDSCAFCFM